MLTCPTICPSPCLQCQHVGLDLVRIEIGLVQEGRRVAAEALGSGERAGVGAAEGARVRVFVDVGANGQP